MSIIWTIVWLITVLGVWSYIIHTAIKDRNDLF